MSIKVYTGRMGSGKTYEVVSVVILGALLRGRRVVSNIAGLDYKAMRKLLISDGVSSGDIGELIQVEHDDVLKPSFWLSDDNKEGAFLRPGDLLVLDEVWRFWEGFMTSRKMPACVMNFFRMHRHFVHPDMGFTCDVALITQDVMDISRVVRAVVEETYYMSKLTALGSSSRYRVDIYMGARLSGRQPFRSLQRAYDKKYFPLYSSHSLKQEGGANAREENIDGRGNIFRGLFFRLVIPVFLVVFVYCAFWLWGFFHPEPKPVKQVASGKQPSVVSALVSVPKNQPLSLIPKDYISGISSSMRPRLSFFVNDGKRAKVVVEWRDAAGGVIRYTDESLQMMGWRVFVSPDGNLGILTNGRESFLISMFLDR
jgi:zona occludens toxin